MGKLSPEMIAKLEEMMGGGGESAGNPDAAQDKQLIISTIREELEPVIRHIVERMQQQDETVQQLTKAVDGIIGGFDEALSGHRRNGLSESLNFGDDFDYDNINSVYKDWEGSDLKEDLIDYIMENNIGDDKLEEMMATLKENAKSKYGKYRKSEPEGVGIEVDIGSESPKKEEEKGEKEEEKGEKEEEKGEKEEEEEKEKPGIYDQLMSQYRASRGHKLGL